MRIWLKLIVATALALAAGAAQAQLYWRADIGYSSALDADIRDKNFTQDGFIFADPAGNNGGALDKVGESSVLSLGVGWRFNSSFRADLTLAYRGGYQLDDNDALPSNFKADLASTSLMLGAYWDFVTGGVAPYVGAGIGWAQNKIDDVVNTPTGPGFPAGFAWRLPGGTWSGVAWSLMAGVGIPLGSRLTLDAGYRFTDLGEIESDAGRITCPPAACNFSYSGFSGKLRAHELTVGLRF